jgi:predicted NAD/FAD-binding protein
MEVNYKYGGVSGVESSASATNMSFAPDLLREPTFFVGKINKHVAFREAISALNAVVVSDLRFKPKDKTAYLAWAKEQEDLWLAEYIGQKINLSELNSRVETIRAEIGDINKRQEATQGVWMKAKKRIFQLFV